MDDFKTGGYCPTCLHATSGCTCMKDYWKSIITTTMDERLKDVNLLDELRETMEDVENDLYQYQQRNGDVWKEKGLNFNGQAQEERFYQKVLEVVTDWRDLGVPIPWSKIIAEAHIGLVREKKLK